MEPGFSKTQTTLEILAREYPIHTATQQGVPVLLIILETFVLDAIDAGEPTHRSRDGNSFGPKEVKGVIKEFAMTLTIYTLK
jgi:hypothetical protein